LPGKRQLRKDKSDKQDKQASPPTRDEDVPTKSNTLVERPKRALKRTRSQTNLGGNKKVRQVNSADILVSQREGEEDRAAAHVRSKQPQGSVDKVSDDHATGDEHRDEKPTVHFKARPPVAESNRESISPLPSKVPPPEVARSANMVPDGSSAVHASDVPYTMAVHPSHVGMVPMYGPFAVQYHPGMTPGPIQPPVMSFSGAFDPLPNHQFYDPYQQLEGSRNYHGTTGVSDAGMHVVNNSVMANGSLPHPNYPACALPDEDLGQGFWPHALSHTDLLKPEEHIPYYPIAHPAHGPFMYEQKLADGSSVLPTECPPQYAVYERWASPRIDPNLTSLPAFGHSAAQFCVQPMDSTAPGPHSAFQPPGGSVTYNSPGEETDPSLFPYPMMVTGDNYEVLSPGQNADTYYRSRVYGMPCQHEPYLDDNSPLNLESELPPGTDFLAKAKVERPFTGHSSGVGGENSPV
jgi:hypothetical protein